MKDMTPNTGDALILDDRIRGVPPGTSAVLASEVGDRGWRPADGTMSLPVLTLDEAAFHHNRDLMLDYARAAGVEIAPHAKTPMAPDLARSLIEAGAWGATVADIRQATVMLRAGISRLLLANEVGGLGGARRLAALASLLAEGRDQRLRRFRERGRGARRCMAREADDAAAAGPGRSRGGPGRRAVARRGGRRRQGGSRISRPIEAGGTCRL